MDSVFIFYGGQIYWKGSVQDFKHIRNSCDQEIYNGAYVYDHPRQDWFYMDGCPRLLSDTPLNLRTMVLLMT